MMKRAFAGLQLNGDRILHRRSLLVIEHVADRIHVTDQAGLGEQAPSMAAGDVLKTAVVDRGVIQRDPTGQMPE